jgi:hypothetical protein
MEGDMRRLIPTTALLGSLLGLIVLLPAPAEAQRRGGRVHAGGLHRTAAVRPVRAGYRPVARRSVAVSRAAYYGRGYNRPAYYRPGVAAGVAAGTLAVGAAAASAPYRYGYSYPAYYNYGYGYPAGNSCLRQQQVWTGYTYQWQWVRVC